MIKSLGQKSEDYVRRVKAMVDKGMLWKTVKAMVDKERLRKTREGYHVILDK